MKNNKTIKLICLAAFCLSLPLPGDRVFAQGTNVTLWQFPTDTGATDLADAWAAWNWGGSTITFDPTQDAQGNANFGSVYVTADPSIQQNAVIVEMYYPNSYPDTTAHIYSTANPENLTTFTNIEFDIKWDNTNSTRDISDFNYPPQPWGDSGIKLQAVENDANADWLLLTNVILPDSVTNGWVHMNVPIDPTIPGISSTIGFALQKYFNDPAFGKVAFWIENFKLDASQKSLPPPTVKSVTKALKGLNVVASSSGQYDRHIGRLRANAGKSWVGQATAANPVTYSFTINNFPQDPATFYGAESLLFLVPNPTQNEAGAPDWNEANCVQVFIQQQSATQSTLHFQYKVNDQNDNTMYNGSGIYTNPPNSWDGVTPNYYESGNLGSVTYAGTAVGTWTVKFTSDSDGVLIAPDGTSSNFVFPLYNADGFFAETTGFNVDLGMQPNATAAIGMAVIYSNFAISNTVTPFYENFLTDTFLDTTNTWDVSMSPANSMMLVPDTAAYSVSWTLPAVGFNLEVGTNLNNLSAWTSPTMYPLVNGAGIVSQLVDGSEIPAGNMAFFNLIQRKYSQLQVLLPGETNAPNTLTGKTGTPTPTSLYGEVDVTINAVDKTYHIVNATDALNLTTTDTQATVTTPAPTLANGTVTVPFYYGTAGSWTVTATDTTSTNIPAATSSSITVQ